MSLFGRSARPPAETPIGPVDGSQMRQAADFMERFNAAVGDDGALRAVCADIYGAVGIRRPEDLFRHADELHLPWRWLEAVGSAAAERGDAMLVSRIFGCAGMWKLQIAPSLQAGDILDLVLPGAPPDILTGLAATALPFLLALPDGAVIFGNQTGNLTAHGLALLAADQITEGGSSPVVTAEAAALARDVLAGRAGHPAQAEPPSARRAAVPSAHAPDLGAAIAQMARVKAALTDLGYRFRDLGTVTFAAGVGVAFGDRDYLVVSVSAGSEHMVFLTSGVLKNLSADQPHDRLRVLEKCNFLTKKNPACPVFLHHAETYWDALMQQCLVVDLALADLLAFGSFVEQLPAMTRSAREKFAEAGAGGQVYAWNDDDIRRLLIRSVT
jgi:hypothetical protein